MREIFPYLQPFKGEKLRFIVPWVGHEPAGSYYVSDPDSARWGWNEFKAQTWQGQLSFSALHLAARIGDKAMVEFFLCGTDANAKDEDSHTPLYYAVRWGSAEGAKVLLDHGASVNDQEHGHTPLGWVIWDGQLGKKRDEMADLLMRYGGHE